MKTFATAVDHVGGPSKMAGILGVSVQAVCFWRDGARKFPFEHGAAVEAATGGEVGRKDLFPNDWRAIWPELATKRKAA